MAAWSAESGVAGPIVDVGQKHGDERQRSRPRDALEHGGAAYHRDQERPRPDGVTEAGIHTRPECKRVWFGCRTVREDATGT